MPLKHPLSYARDPSTHEAVGSTSLGQVDVAAATKPAAAGPTRLESALLGSALAAWGGMLLISAWLLPYFQHDELAFSEWSRLVAPDGGFFFPSTTLLTYQRPLVYVGQGWLWLAAGHSESLGRLFNGSFVALLLWAVFRVTDLLAGRRQAVLATLAMLNLRGLEQTASLAMTDVPVGALAGAAGAIALGGPPSMDPIARHGRGLGGRCPRQAVGGRCAPRARGSTLVH